MYEHARKKIVAKFGSVQRFADCAGVPAVNLYCAFSGKRPMWPRYKKLIAESLNEDEKTLFEEVEK